MMRWPLILRKGDKKASSAPTTNLTAVLVEPRKPVSFIELCEDTPTASDVNTFCLERMLEQEGHGGYIRLEPQTIELARAFKAAA